MPGFQSRGRGRGRPPTSGSNTGVCYHFQKHGQCKFGAKCKFSHDLTLVNNQGNGSAPRAARVEETLEQSQARASYSAWRSLLRNPMGPHDRHIRRRVWEEALDILNSDDRDWKQVLPQDLDSDTLHGLQHIRALMEQQSNDGQIGTFVSTSKYFLLVMTHPALVDCLSVDTFVSHLYNIMAGANGDRAIPFFQQLCEILVAFRTENTRTVSLETIDSTLVAIAVTLCELLRRQPRARYNEELPALASSLENAVQMLGDDTSSITPHLILSRTQDVRAMIARAHGLLYEETKSNSADTATIARGSGYPHHIEMPRDRHDNDKADITEINIFPTRAEIMSDVHEFLPSTDPDQPHFLTDKSERHIDTQFRLLRYDIFGKLKAALAEVMDSILKKTATLDGPRIDIGDIRAYPYTNAHVSYVSFTGRTGLQAQISFLQPHSIRKKSAAERRRWWEDSRRLEDGVLLSLIWTQGSAVQHLFFTVVDRTRETAKDHGLDQNSAFATVTAKLLKQDYQATEDLLNLSCKKFRGVLLEYPRLLPATFAPVLQNLQNMQRLSRLPFRQWILPDPIEEHSVSKQYLDIPPPLYARTTDFKFPLQSILKQQSGVLTLPASSLASDHALIDQLEAQTDLDRGQCQALVAALTREFAFIQGPPGTGKSFLGIKLMKILLDVKSKADLGPIVVVCYTNHALDQFLEHLINTGIRKVIRIGGQSRSELLEDHNIRKVASVETKTRAEGYQVHKAYEDLESHETSIKRILGRLHGIQKGANWKHLEYHLRYRYPRIHVQFQQIDREGFTLVGRHPFDIWTADIAMHDTVESFSSTASDTEQLAAIIQRAQTNVHCLANVERSALIQYWVQELQQKSRDELFEILDDASTAQQRLTNVHEEVNRRVLQNADVIGLTTTGLAKNILTLQHLRCKVIICEEAGEVMEPHMISALLPTVEHFIQIGDHQQLRPTINNFKELSLESHKGRLYQLDRSQFERLSVGEPGRPLMPVAQLNVQRRMRPDISALIRETIYAKLLDHRSTIQLPDVVGLRENVYWLDHENLEDNQQSEIHHQKSQSNKWEVGMVHALVRHVVRQGVYASSDIAVLTPYTGQLQKLRTAMRNDFEIVLSERDQEALEEDGFSASDATSGDDDVPQGIRRKPLEKKKLSDMLRIATIDNFQGEEAKIIIVSLVRSNEKKKVGFLKTTNRINVLLSRAQHGMYLIGNVDTYSNVPMWAKVISMLQDKDAVGPSLGLCCPRHKEKVIEIKQPDDFLKFSPEGGCQEACTERLRECGHRCQSRCHSKAMHDVWQCEKPCQRRHKPCDHPCQKKTCGEDCGKCMIKVHNVKLPCKHVRDDIFCYRTQDLQSIACNTIVAKKVPGCGHTVNIQCSRDVTSETFRCPTPCGEQLTCGHTCPGTCGRCHTKDDQERQVIKHLKCTKICGRRFATCNHNCGKACHQGEDCGLCRSKCEVECKHSRCPLLCHDSCPPCTEPCTWSCSHQGACTMPCSAPCNRLPCDKRCTLLLRCGHQCPGLCGENCPEDYCQQCGMKSDVEVDMMEFKKYSEIDLNDTPVIFLGCGHFFTAETLDGLVGISEVYEIDNRTGEFSCLKDLSGEMATKVPSCPSCRAPIRQFATQRYNRLINRAVIDEMSKRFIVTGQDELRQIEERLSRLEKAFEETRKTTIGPTTTNPSAQAEVRAIGDLAQKLQKRYKPASQLEKDIKQLQRNVADQHQPAHKLHEATVHAMTRAKSSPIEKAFAALNLIDTNLDADRDQRVVLGSQVVRIKIECLLLEDKFQILATAKSRYPEAISTLKIFGGSPLLLTRPFLQSAATSFTQCEQKNLPKLAVEAALYYARIARLYETSGLTEPKDREKATEYHEKAKAQLEKAQKLCDRSFQGVDTLLLAVNEMIKLLRKEWHEEVTLEELAAIKKAMVSGRGGIATHSGHWYNCANGHPFAIGECGMPMELARCPECGARIGGQNHQAAQGVTRAENME